MFGLLKNKLASFIKGLSGKEEKKEAEALPAEEPKQVETKAIPKEEPKAEKKPEPKIEKKAAEEKKEAPKPEPKAEKKESSKPKPAEAISVPKPIEKPAEKKTAPKPVEEKPIPKPEPIAAPKKSEPAPVVDLPKPVEAKKAEEKKPIETKPELVAAPHKPAEAPKKSFIDALFRKPTLKTEEKIAPKPVEQPVQNPSTPSEPKPIEASKPLPAQPQKIPMQPDIQKQAERDFSHLERKASSAPEKKDIAPKIGFATTIKSIFSSDITIGEGEVSDLLSDLELSLLEADVAYDVSLEVSSQLRAKLVGMKVPKGKVEEKTREAIQGVLASVMTSERKFDLAERVRSLEKPAKILFVGPNGAGKTTTMAKVAHMLLQGGMTVVFSASDTFRAAAIEQTEVHAGRLGVKVVKSKYGADPASVAFDAVNFARTHNIDVVLIDSAGRQDTNANLLDELKKISRVAKPDIKIYIGESIGGNSLIDQVKAFDEAIGMDGAILTKIDCDAKGGTALSLTKSTGIPVLYLGVGQAYADLIPFEPDKIAREIMS